MPHKIRALLVAQVEALFAGRFAEMLPCFDLPLAVEIGGSLMVLSSPRQFAEAMGDYRDGMITAGVTGLCVRMTAVELPRRGRFRVWADFDHHHAGGVDTSADQMIIYCRQEADGVRVELLHCTRLARGIETPQRRALLA